VILNLGLSHLDPWERALTIPLHSGLSWHQIAFVQSGKQNSSFLETKSCWPIVARHTNWGEQVMNVVWDLRLPSFSHQTGISACNRPEISSLCMQSAWNIWSFQWTLPKFSWNGAHYLNFILILSTYLHAMWNKLYVQPSMKSNDFKWYYFSDEILREWKKGFFFVIRGPGTVGGIKRDGLREGVEFQAFWIIERPFYRSCTSAKCCNG
jgi:hypothetical protein